MAHLKKQLSFLLGDEKAGRQAVLDVNFANPPPCP
jgi:hypothetical protein